MYKEVQLSLFGFAPCQLTCLGEIGSQGATAWKHLLLSILVSSTSSFPPALLELSYFAPCTHAQVTSLFLNHYLLTYSSLISCKDSVDINTDFLNKVFWSDVSF